MRDVTSQPWFWPALIVVVGLPICLIVLGELRGLLVRRQSAWAKPVGLLRSFVIPVLALWLLLRELDGDHVDVTFTRVVATAFGFGVILLMLSGADAALFGSPEPGSWRARLPGIFVDIGRLVLVVIGAAVLMSTVWGMNVGGLFAALGVTSIVIGLALQGAVGPVIAGLFLLFEQPFRLGDWLETASATGRVIEVNWRAVHIETGGGLQIIPNAQLATGSFKNMSRTSGGKFTAGATMTFSVNDAPDEVVALLHRVAADITPVSGGVASVRAVGAGEYAVSLPITSPSDAGRVTAVLTRHVWYAARRRGLHLDDAEYEFPHHPTPDQLRRAGSTLGVSAEAAEELAGKTRLLDFAEGETIQHIGAVPPDLLVILSGSVSLVATSPGGDELQLATLGTNDYLGLTTLTRQPVVSTAVANAPTTVIAIPRSVTEEMVRHRPALARQLGDAIEERRNAARTAFDPV